MHSGNKLDPKTPIKVVLFLFILLHISFLGILRIYSFLKLHPKGTLLPKIVGIELDLPSVSTTFPRVPGQHGPLCCSGPNTAQAGSPREANPVQSPLPR